MCIRDRNKVTLAVPEGNPKGIKSFDDLAEKLASGEVPVSYTHLDVYKRQVEYPS